MLIGGVDNGDYRWLMKNEGRARYWSCPKDSQRGDRAIIYVSSPHSEVVATAEIQSQARPGDELNMQWRYGAKIGGIKLLPAPIPLAELKALCPEWRWLNYPRAYAYIPLAESKRLERRARLETPPVENAQVEVVGAGFGSIETNRLVERAAINAVSRYFRSEGANVKSRELEKCGYDLDVRNGRGTLHVEVKGVSNAGLSFPITEGEVRCAKSDSKFRLAVVTNALEPSRRKIHIFTGRQFLAKFKRRPIAHIATLT
jgi:hypothetical protein